MFYSYAENGLKEGYTQKHFYKTLKFQPKIRKHKKALEKGKIRKKSKINSAEEERKKKVEKE